MTEINDYDRRRIADQARAYMTQVLADGDATEALAGLYAAAQVIERVLLERRLCSIHHLALIQVVGKRVGAGLNPVVELDLVRRKDVQ